MRFEEKLKNSFTPDKFNNIMSIIGGSFHDNFNLAPIEINAICNVLTLHLTCYNKNGGIFPSEKVGVFIEYITTNADKRQVASIYNLSVPYMGVILDEIYTALCEIFSYEESEDDELFIRIANHLICTKK